MPETSPRGTYLQVANAIRKGLADGSIASNELLPSEAQLMCQFGVARTTVRRAFRELELAGEIETIAGVGRRVKGAVQGAPFQRVVDALVRQVRDGSLPTGVKIPSEAELATEHGVTRNTVRRAVRELEAAGVIESRHGVGRFVRQAPSAEDQP
ncbi:GntR family transcriptional regulator [Streptacidiphilus sp. ASG 303]|uniref:GntR family transcriptional regulator n=1 Tax=Streptacidiphilus sp. ASG 303 TaxID=2896847 RepID=UPI0035AF3351